MNWNPKGLSDVHTCWKRTQAFNVKCGISTFQKYWCLFIILSVDMLFKLDCLIKHASTIVEHTVLCHYQQGLHHRGFWYCRRFCYCAEIKMMVSVINWPAIGFFALWQMLQNLKSCKRKCYEFGTFLPKGHLGRECGTVVTPTLPHSDQTYRS